MKRVLYILLAVTLLSLETSAIAATSTQDPEITAKHVRKFINKGNKSYRNGDYAEAETCYKDALQEDPNSDLAKFNLALTLLKQQTANKAQSDTLRLMSKSYFQDVIGSGSTADKSFIEKSYYNLGNIAFGEEDYAGSIEMYKEVLRMNPDNITARQNLRVAQIKLKEQQNNQGKDNQQQQQQQQQQNKQEQDKQEQTQNQNQQQEQEKKDNNGQQSGSQSNQNEQPQEKNNKESGGANRAKISEENADKILKAAAKQEEQTRKKVENQQKENTSRRIIGNPW